MRCASSELHIEDMRIEVDADCARRRPRHRWRIDGCGRPSSDPSQVDFKIVQPSSDPSQVDFKIVQPSSDPSQVDFKIVQPSSDPSQVDFAATTHSGTTATGCRALASADLRSFAQDLQHQRRTGRCYQRGMTLRTPLISLSIAVALLAVSTLDPGHARACSDAGPYNFCNDGGAAWISCAVHSDCPSGQLCNDVGVCGCSAACVHGETCSEAGCRCATEPRPATMPGCVVVESGCGAYRQQCDAGPPPPPMCNADAGGETACSSDADCPAAGDFPLVCTSRGVCDCPPAPTRASSGCSVGGGAGRAGRGLVFALLGLAAVSLTRRRARRFR